MTEPSGGSSERPRRPVVVPAIALTAFTAVGITALLGGLREAPEEPEALGQGAVIDQGQFTTKVVESRVTVERAQSRFQEDKRFVDVIFDVRNNGDETASVGSPPQKLETAFTLASFAGSLIKIDPAFPEDAGPNTFAQGKGGTTRQLHPGVTSQVVLRYRLKDTDPPPKQITLDVASFEWEPDFNNVTPRWKMVATEAGDKWLPEIKARVTLPVKEGDGA
ncbi:hypothetical protein E1295_48045 [Nonomuraea mesophila]|uniref:DUF4352 domain-containing protein n=1 Tax=Nonomuraea mesophila TaxID=2530382 RepID=A0A4R5DWD6_9ACTN|nr:hypothetical protein [Nonomuraea mesophila]TDE18903.1 hypothetical protein E1295_48045 [Nonomuraea mesophila]